MDDLPLLPFEQVLSYLSLEDLLKARTVSRSWRNKFDFEMKSLCFSESPRDFVKGKDRLINDQFAKNFVNSHRFASFFTAFGQTILSNLKHLRLCELELNEEDRTVFARSLNVFCQLQELDLIRFGYPPDGLKRTGLFYSLAGPDPKMQVELNLPMLHSVQLDKVFGIEKLTLNSPRLQKVKLFECSQSLRLELVHAESVEKVICDRIEHLEVMKLKSLKYLYMNSYRNFDSSFLTAVPELKEIHLLYSNEISNLFEQKRQNGCTHLKIYFVGVLLDGLNDSARSLYAGFHEPETLVQLTEKPFKLADEIPNRRGVNFAAIERVAVGLENQFMARLTDLSELCTYGPVQDVERLLDFLKFFSQIVDLTFVHHELPDVFERLPEHCAVQRLIMLNCKLPDFQFLFRLQNLIYLYLDRFDSNDVEFIPNLFEKLQFFSTFVFRPPWPNDTRIEIKKVHHRKHFEVSVGELGNRSITIVPDLNVAIQLAIENTLE